MKFRQNFLSKEEFEQIHSMTVRILEEVGVHLQDETARETFRQHGARIEGEVVYISQDMLEYALKQIPSSFEICSRSNKVAQIGDGQIALAPMGGPMYISKGNEHYRTTPEDFKNFQKLCHSSKVLNVCAPWITEPAGIDPNVVRAYQLAVTLKYTDKPISTFVTSQEDSILSIEMLEKFYGIKDKYMTIGPINAITPLTYDHNALASVRVYANKNQPLIFASCGVPGASCPVTLSGTIAVNNAEVLAGIVYAQLLRPGLPVVYGNTTGGDDLRYVALTIGSPEAAMLAQATAGMANYYNIPCRTGGSLSDSKCVDWQAGVEASMMLLSTLMSSAGFVFQSCGIMDSFGTLSYEKFVLDEQNIEMFSRMTNGCVMTPTQEDFETIKEVGPGNQYLLTDQTLERSRESLYIPKLFCKMPYSSWEDQNRPMALDYARQEVERRLKDYCQPEITVEQENILRSYVGDLADTF